MLNIYNRVYLIQKVCHTNIAQKMDRTVSSLAHQYQIAKYLQSSGGMCSVLFISYHIISLYVILHQKPKDHNTISTYLQMNIKRARRLQYKKYVMHII